ILPADADQRRHDHQRGSQPRKPATGRGRRCAPHADAERADHPDRAWGWAEHPSILAGIADARRRKLNELDFALDAKALDDDGHIEGLAAGYGNLDHGGDVILPGAISRSIAGRKSVPMLMYHDQKRPAGVWTDFQ